MLFQNLREGASEALGKKSSVEGRSPKKHTWLLSPHSAKNVRMKASAMTGWNLWRIHWLTLRPDGEFCESTIFGEAPNSFSTSSHSDSSWIQNDKNWSILSNWLAYAWSELNHDSYIDVMQIDLCLLDWSFTIHLIEDFNHCGQWLAVILSDDFHNVCGIQEAEEKSSRRLDDTAYTLFVHEGII